jgi:hypothetical protein
VVEVLTLAFTVVAAVTGVLLVRLELARRRDEARRLITIAEVDGIPPAVSPVREIRVGLVVTPGRQFRRYSVAVALEDDRTIGASEPRDLHERGGLEFSVPIFPPIGRDQVVFVKVLNSWNRTVKSERRRI